MSPHPTWSFCIIPASRWLSSQFSYHPIGEFHPLCARSLGALQVWLMLHIHLLLRRFNNQGDPWSLSCFPESNLGSHWTPIPLLSSTQSHWSSSEVSVISYLAAPSCLKNEVSFRPHSRSKRTEDWIIKPNHISQSLLPYFINLKNSGWHPAGPGTRVGRPCGRPNCIRQSETSLAMTSLEAPTAKPWWPVSRLRRSFPVPLGTWAAWKSMLAPFETVYPGHLASVTTDWTWACAYVAFSFPPPPSAWLFGR